MNRSFFWIATLLSGLLHVLAVGGLVIAAIWPRFTPPELLEAYGDSDREGLAVSAIAVDPGAYRQGDQQAPGGDNAPEAVPGKPEPAVEPPGAAESEPSEKAPAEKPSTDPAPEQSSPPSADAPAIERRPAEPANPLPPREDSVPNPSPKTTVRPKSGSNSGLPGAPGGARLPSGTPSRGGTVGSRVGVRMAAGGRPLVYPPAAREAGIEGTSVIRLRIAADGRVLEARVHNSSGHKILDDAALQWARAQRFLPARVGGTPVEAEAVKAVKFYLY